MIFNMLACVISLNIWLGVKEPVGFVVLLLKKKKMCSPPQTNKRACLRLYYVKYRKIQNKTKKCCTYIVKIYTKSSLQRL